MKHLLAAAISLFCAHRAIAASPDDVAKADYLYKFVPFIVWPESAFSAADSPIAICIIGKDPFGPDMDREAEKERIGGRPVVVRHIPLALANSGCHVAYVGGSTEQSVSQALEVLRAQPVLTVSDAATNATGRGIINFVTENGRVRFEIDERAAEQSHLSVSSKLLELALQTPKPK